MFLVVRNVSSAERDVKAQASIRHVVGGGGNLNSVKNKLYRRETAPTLNGAVYSYSGSCIAITQSSACSSTRLFDSPLKARETASPFVNVTWVVSMNSMRRSPPSRHPKSLAAGYCTLRLTSSTMLVVTWDMAEVEG